MDTNTTPAHIHHRIAEVVSRGWPSWECSEADVALILERQRTLTDDPHGIAVAAGRPVSFVEAVLAEAAEYEVLHDWSTT